MRCTARASNGPDHLGLRARQAICEGLGNEYELACEHAHSCLTLIAHTKFKHPVKPEHLPLTDFFYDEPKDGPEAAAERWHTWIDYEKFHELVESKQPFTAMVPCSRNPYGESLL